MKVKEFLEKKGVSFKSFEHPPVYTCEEAEKYTKDVRGIHCKNLFLKEKKGRRYYLIIIPAEKKLDMDELSSVLNDKVKFANEQDLQDILGLSAGSVSPFGLIYDEDHKVKLVVDKEVWESAHVSFHPNVNTETLELSKEDFRKFVDAVGSEVIVL